jgi:hypothetical protein
MADMTISLRLNPDTGKRDIIVKFDPSTTPVEYEQMHRAIVEKLIGSGIRPEDMGELIIDRGT